MHAGDDLVAVDVRHPVVERHVPDAFVPNDVTLDAGARQLIVLTGPNMGGKSTYLRQTALLCLMAQAGSFVPARSAKLPVVDRIFARVGASDNIARGQSTFMVEMQETANILHSATSRSLLILDEIGRGTSTFDGLSLAWAVAEHLASNPRARPKTIFATHYHELTDLADALPNVTNCHVVVREWQDDIVFLRKVVPGRSDRSYGIQVARLAGLPPSVVARAREILNGLERDELSRGGRPSLNASDTSGLATAGAMRAASSGSSRRRASRDPLRRASQGDRRRQPDAACRRCRSSPSSSARRAGDGSARCLSRITDFTNARNFIRATAAAESARRGTRTESRALRHRRGAGPAAGFGIRTLRSPPALSDDLDAEIRYPLSPGRRGAGAAAGDARRDDRRRPRPRRSVRPSGRVQVILVNQSDSRTAGRRRCPSTRSRSSAAAPGGTSLIGNTDDWLRMVFAHEYTHIVHLSRGQGWIGGLRRVFGRMPLLYPNLYPADVADRRPRGVRRERADRPGTRAGSQLSRDCRCGRSRSAIRAARSRERRPGRLAIRAHAVCLRRVLSRVPGRALRRSLAAPVDGRDGGPHPVPRIAGVQEGLQALARRSVARVRGRSAPGDRSARARR